MDRKDYISSLPVKVLALILAFVPKKNDLFTVSKHFYEAACLASKSDYEICLHGNAKIQNCFESFVASKRIYHDFVIECLDMSRLSKDDVEKLLKILEKFGRNAQSLAIKFDVIAEDDVRAILSFFPNIKSLFIKRDILSEGIVLEEKLSQYVETLVFISLTSITFDSHILQFDKIFYGVQITDTLKQFSISVPKLYDCFEFLKNNRSIEDLWLRSANPCTSIPVDHLKLKNLTLDIPEAKSLVSSFVKQTELVSFNLLNFWESDDSSTDVSSLDSSSAESSNLELDAEWDRDILMAAINMKNLEQLDIIIDQIPKNDFVHFAELTQLKKLVIRGRKLNKIRTFSSVAIVLNVTELLLFFKSIPIPNSVLEEIAKMFPKVTELLCQTEFLCDAFILFNGNLPRLEKLTLIRTHDYGDDCMKYAASAGTKITVNPNLKMLSLQLRHPEETNVHKFMIRVALTTPNIESLEMQIISLKFIPDNLIYILRNFKQLKNIILCLDLFPYNNAQGQTKTFDEMVQYGSSMELKIIEILKEFGSRLDYIKLTLSASNDVQGELWIDSFAEQYESIETDDMNITMKKSLDIDEFDMFS